MHKISLSRRMARLCGAVALLACLHASAASIVITREIKSNALQRQWAYSVYLPDNYEQSNLRYPVLYLLHGNGQDLYAWTIQGRIQPTADALIARGDMPPAIIVMPDAGTSWYVDRKEKMETAFVQELMPDVERTFRTVAERDGRVIAGLSMGGFAAARFSMKYPEKFAAAALLSPAIYETEPPANSTARRVGVFGEPEFDTKVWQSLNYTSLWDAYLAKKTPVPMYINSGDDDEFLIESDATKFYSLLRKNRHPAELRIVNGGHAWAVWESTIGEAMQYMFKYTARPVMAK